MKKRNSLCSLHFFSLLLPTSLAFFLVSLLFFQAKVVYIA
jgi:hypothetical protein